ncbi:MAG: hypothetical protein ACFB21_07480, partial [Opitutales bacterium]
ALADAGYWLGPHNLLSDDDPEAAAWIHANLHREDGDKGNAAYWYQRAGKPVSTATFTEERAQIRQALQGKV